MNNTESIKESLLATIRKGEWLYSKDNKYYIFSSRQLDEAPADMLIDNSVELYQLIELLSGESKEYSFIIENDTLYLTLTFEDEPLELLSFDANIMTFIHPSLGEVTFTKRKHQSKHL